jgi:hypothetical protein
MLEEIARFEPVMADSVRAAVDGVPKTDFLRLAEQPFTTVPKKWID